MQAEELFPTMPIATKRGCRLPEDWQPSPEARRFANQRGLDPDEQAIAFRAHWLAKPTKNTSLNWSLNWQTWILNQVRWAPKSFKSRFEEKAISVPPATEWGPRLRGYKPGGFWMENIWGPRPESGKCWASKEELDAWRQSA